MLYNLEPSTELSGGAWYTDNELDEEFINTMLNIVEAFIKRAVSARYPSCKQNSQILYSVIDRRLHLDQLIIINPVHYQSCSFLRSSCSYSAPASLSLPFPFLVWILLPDPYGNPTPGLHQHYKQYCRLSV